MKANKINISNYEAFLLDFYEGTLSTEMEALLMDFLNENPHLQNELPIEGQLFSYTQEDVKLSSDFKKNLKVPDFSFNTINTENIDDFLIAETEGILTQAQSDQLNAFLLSNPDYKNDLLAYKLTKLEPEKKVVFPDKSSLKKQTPYTLRPLYTYSGIAASLLIMVGLFFAIPTEIQKPGIQYTSTHKASRDIRTYIPETQTETPESSHYTGNTTSPLIAKTNTKKEDSPKNKQQETKSASPESIDAYSLASITTKTTKYIETPLPEIISNRISPIPVVFEDNSEEQLFASNNMQGYLFHRAASLFISDEDEESTEEPSLFANMATWTLKTYGKVFNKNVKIDQVSADNRGSVKINDGNIRISKPKK